MYSVTAPRTASNRTVRSGGRTITTSPSIAIANRFVWIVKKLKKFAGLNVGTSLWRVANW